MRSHRSAFHAAVVACPYGVAVTGPLAGAAAVSRDIPAASALVLLIIGVGLTVEAVWRLAFCTS
jgi:hypothetical protein